VRCLQRTRSLYEFIGPYRLHKHLRKQRTNLRNTTENTQIDIRSVQHPPTYGASQWQSPPTSQSAATASSVTQTNSPHSCRQCPTTPPQSQPSASDPSRATSPQATHASSPSQACSQAQTKKHSPSSPIARRTHSPPQVNSQPSAAPTGDYASS